MYRYKKHF